MTNVGNGYWVTDVPLAAGANQYWFYVNNNTNLWVADPANSPIYAPDGLTGTARRAFNKVNVPYDAAKQNYAPLAARVIENPRPTAPHGTWSYVPIQIGTTTRTIGVYLPPGLRPEPRRAVQDDLHAARRRPGPVRLDEHGRRPGHHGQPDPGRPHRASGRHHDEHELPGQRRQGYPNLRNIVIPFVESNYNVSTERDRPGVRGSVGGFIVTHNLINFDADEVRLLRVVEWRRVRRPRRRTWTALHPLRRRALGLRSCPTPTRWPPGPDRVHGERRGRRCSRLQHLEPDVHDLRAGLPLAAWGVCQRCPGVRRWW